MTVGRVVKFIVLCVIVGAIAAAFGIGVEEFWRGVLDTLRAIGTWIADHGRWLWPYFLVGAGIVVPIYIVVYLYRRTRRPR
jgi:hypothetical protein